MSAVYLSIGSNVGDSLTIMRKAATDIEKNIGTIETESSIYESEPWGFEAEQNFLNAVLEVESPLSPEEVLFKINEIESVHGRIRSQICTYSSRTLDIDIVFYDDFVIDGNTLAIPHPKLHERLFVLLPLAEISPDLIHPASKLSIRELLAVCRDSSKIHKTNNTWRI